MTAESYDDNYLDDEDADWVYAPGRAGLPVTPVYAPGSREKGRRDLIAWFDSSETRPTKSVSRTARWMCSVAG